MSYQIGRFPGADVNQTLTETCILLNKAGYRVVFKKRTQYVMDILAGIARIVRLPDHPLR
ncbi:hypothetical protein DYU11_12445 [Fibrisoma montanum]|uniref:Uncharacterized protein n=1 Tax=Fibrisoma montanum TaxID=2305895 RepID=A0A418MBS3_9BACT|nr:hypothetical protein [Fibrisoma montanum]RIV23776.1 hypothetical protein DYU11_12445 [Fibrisoma montanum]